MVLREEILFTGGIANFLPFWSNCSSSFDEVVPEILITLFAKVCGSF